MAASVAFTDGDLYRRGVETLVAGTDPSAFHLLAACLNDTPVAAALAFDWTGDCSIYNVGTLEHARRGGIATALTTDQVH